jgi:polysaccharide pyruvyl transferase WcaK-like protein
MGPFGYGNLGDAATQDAVILQLRREYPEAEIVGFSLNPKDTETRHSIKSFPISWQSWDHEAGQNHGLADRVAGWLKAQDSPTLYQAAKLIQRAPRELQLVSDTFRSLDGVDVLILSGGGQLEDYWGHGPWSYPYTFFKWSIAARLRGTRIFLLSVGAGPIKARLSKLFIRTGVSLCEYRSYRDHFSLELVNGPLADDPVYPDLAWGIPVDAVVPAPRPPGVGLVVGLGPIGYFKEGCWPEHDRAKYGAYLDKLASFVDWLVQQGHVAVFVPGEVHYDQLAVDDLLTRLSALRVDRKKILRPEVTTVVELLAQLSSIDVFVGSRFHGLLLAQALGKPGIGLSYQEKVDSLMHDAEQSENCFPVGTFDLADLKSSFSAIERDYEAVRQQVGARAEKCRSSLEEQYRRVFAAIAT